MRKTERAQKAKEVRKEILEQTMNLPFESFLLLAVEIAMDRPHNQQVIANNKTTLSGVSQLELALDGYGRAEVMIAFASFQDDEEIEWGSGMDAAFEEAQVQALEDLQSFYPDLEFEEGEVNAISFLVLNEWLEKFIKLPEIAEQIAQNDIVNLLGNAKFRAEILDTLHGWNEIQMYLDSIIDEDQRNQE